MIRQVRARGRVAQGNRAVTLLRLMWIVWLPFLAYPVTGFYRAYPISQLLHAHLSPLHRGAALTAIVLFNALYVWTTWRNRLSRAASAPGVPARSWLPLVVLTALPIALMLLDRKDWLTLFILTSASMGARLPAGWAAWAVAALLPLIAAAGWLAHASWSTIGPTLLLVGFVGVTVISLVQVAAMNRELRAAREEIARLAVDAERLRFARDLHDLLGHSLSLIALKSELAGRLAAAAPQRAVGEMRDVESVAREALREVREAVSGYRRPALASELRGAQELLAAAGIVYQYDGASITAPPVVEAALSWAVREGVTNVVKHSRARHCTVRVTCDGSHVGVEVVDDGQGAPREPVRPSSAMGNGLAGLAERVTALGGQCEAGPHAGGFRLTVTLPIDHSAMREPAQPDPDGIPAQTVRLS